MSAERRPDELDKNYSVRLSVASACWCVVRGWLSDGQTNWTKIKNYSIRLSVASACWCFVHSWVERRPDKNYCIRLSVASDDASCVRPRPDRQTVRQVLGTGRI